MAMREAAAETHDASGADAGTLATLMAACLMVLQISLSNAALYPLFDAVLPIARDINVGTGVVANLLIVLASARRPTLLRERVLAPCAAGLTVLGMATVLGALRLGSAVLLAGGAVIVGLGATWVSLTCAVARCTLNQRALLAGVPCAFGCARLVSWALLQLPVAIPLTVLALCPLAALPFGRVRAASVIQAVGDAPARSDVQLLHPASFIPLTSRLFVCLFLATTALGFNLRFGPVEGSPNATLPSLLVFACLALVGLRGGGVRHYDTMWACAIALVVAGFLVAPLASLGSVTQALIAMGGACLDVVFAVVLASAAARNPLSSVTIFAWGGAISSLASILGANIGLFVGNNAGHDQAFLVSAGVAVALVLYALLGLRELSISGLVEAIEPFEPVRAPAEQANDGLGLERACDLVAERGGLTPREREVLALVARGRNNAFIQERLTLTRNTVKTYVKRIYAKLDVHSQQEVIDLVEATAAATRQDGPPAT